MVHPLKTIRVIVQNGQLRQTAVAMVQVFHQSRNAPVLRHLGQLPLHPPSLVPLVKFPQILPHKEQLLARMHHHKSICQPQIGELLLPVAGHLPQHGGLSVYHLVMGEHKHKFLAVGIDHAESELPVVVAAEIRVKLDILQIIVHKAHIPLQVKAQPVLLQIPCDPGKGRALLGNGQHPGIALLHDRIQVLDQLNGLQIFLAPVDIGHPLPVLLAIVKIEHAGHSVHTDAVHMELLHPEQSVGNEIVGHLRPAVVVDQSPPVRMASLSGIPVLIEACPVKVGQPVHIPGKMGRHPVQNNPYPGLVEFIDKIHKVFRRTVSGGGSIIPHHLVSPGGVEGMLHHRHQLHMGVPHLLHIGNQPGCDFTVIGIGLSLRGIRHRAQVHLVHAHRGVAGLEFFPGLQKSCVPPGKTVQIRHHRRRLRAQLRGVSVRIGLQIGQASLELQLIFIVVPRARIRQEKLKYARVPQPAHLVHPSVPSVKISHHTDPHGSGSPDRKVHTLHTFQNHGMSSQFLIDGIVYAVLEFFHILLGDLGRKTVCIPPRPLCAVLFFYQIVVHRKILRLLRKQGCKIPVLVRNLHLHFPATLLKHHGSALRTGKIRLYQCLLSRRMGSQQFMGIVALRINDLLDFRPVHQLVCFLVHNLYPFKMNLGSQSVWQ